MKGRELALQAALRVVGVLAAGQRERTYFFGTFDCFIVKVVCETSFGGFFDKVTALASPNRLSAESTAVFGAICESRFL